MSQRWDASHSSATPTPSAFSHDASQNSSANTTPEESPGNDHTLQVDDIAVVGIGCRVPGGNNSPSQLWDFLLKKGDASGDIPSMRWEPYLRRDPRNADILAKTTSKGYCLDHLEDFDASFFNISPREAEQMDPQQRMALEVTWEALENAGIPPQSLAGSDTAVIMGVNSDDYARLLLEDLPNIEAWMGVGTAFCGIPNRISYLLDLLGPSFAVDGACASSLVAIHQARQALLSRETNLAIAGGVNALIGPGLTRVLDKAGAISADGRCRSFDDSAAGYGRGEGAGVVILKRLTSALVEGDHILAVLKGSAVGADGRTNGIMAPNQKVQEIVARKALQEARVTPCSISYVEAHATSTKLGDPCEVAALANVYGSGAHRDNGDQCLIGSIKSNIGHLEAGAGVLGFIKAVMAVREGIIPPQANLTKPNTRINWSENMLRPCTEPTKWPDISGPRRAAIASYGYGGTVSHAIIEAATTSQRQALNDQSDQTGPVLLLLSAPQPGRLTSSALTLARWLESDGANAPLGSVATTLATRRGHHRFRAAVVADSRSDAVSLLNKLAHQSKDSFVLNDQVLPDYSKGTVWMFSGHGAQWHEMGQTLLASRPAFLDVVQHLEPLIQDEMGFSTIEALSTGDFDSTDKIQVLTFVMHMGIAAVLQEDGVAPQAVVGHSMGEIAASVVAGALSLREGALISCKRARLYREVMGEGAMVLVSMTYGEAIRELGGREDISVAIDSSPSSCVVSGTVEGIAQMSALWIQRHIQVRTIRSDVAFHSNTISKLAVPLRKALQDELTPRPPKIPLYSTSLINPREECLRGTEYWIDNMIKPVLLRSTISAAASDGYRVFLEVSSHPIITHSVNETLMDAETDNFVVVPTMTRTQDAEKSLLLAVGRLHCLGDPVEFSKVHSKMWLDGVPGTSWAPQPYWRPVEAGPITQRVTHDVLAHNLLGTRTLVWGSGGTLWQTSIDENSKPFPGNHPLHGAEIVPAAVLLNTFLAATSSRSLHSVSLQVPVVVSPPRDVQVFLDQYQIRISSKLASSEESSSGDTSWLINTTGRLGSAGDVASFKTVDIGDIRSKLKDQLKPGFAVDYLASVGVPEMGFPWQVLEHTGNDMEMLAKVDTNPGRSDVLGALEGSWAPIFDSATSIASTIFYKEPHLWMPTTIDRVMVAPGAKSPKVGYVYIKKVASRTYATDIFICNESGEVLAEFQSMTFASIEGGSLSRKSALNSVYRMAWPPAQLAEQPFTFRQVHFLADEASRRLQDYEAQLAQLGYQTQRIKHETLQKIPKGSIVVFIPNQVRSVEEIYQVSLRSCESLLAAVRLLIDSSLETKIFCITESSTLGNWTSLGHAPLHGLARIIYSEQPQIWGALIEVQDANFPLQAIKYVHGSDVVKIEDTVARTARLRPFSADHSDSNHNSNGVKFSPQGTYLITGGLGALGLEVAIWMAQKGARRILLVSRRKLPRRTDWKDHVDDAAVQKVIALEALGVTVHALSVDMSIDHAGLKLADAIDQLSLPPVTGIVHAAGILADQLVTEITTEAFSNVIAPKILGALALHSLFPPKTLDFFVMFSSCGQLLGFPGQASYASGNAFLDSLASYRRGLGDNSISMMWTSWRGLGMAASTDYINAELNVRGVTDVTKEEAFLAWDKVATLSTDHAVILRTLQLDAGMPSPHPILNDILVRRRAAVEDGRKGGPGGDATTATRTGPELEAFLVKEITKCVAHTLSVAESEVSSRTALTEMGMDSIMTVIFRSQLQLALRVKVPPTLVWKYPTVAHLVKHFMGEMGGSVS